MHRGHSIALFIVLPVLGTTSTSLCVDALALHVAPPTTQRDSTLRNKNNTPRSRCALSETSFRLPEWDGELSEEDEELIRLIRGPLGASIPRPRPKSIVILSDTTGVTAKAAVEKSLAQFNGCDERFANPNSSSNSDSRSSKSIVGRTNYRSPLRDETDDGTDDADCENLTTQIFPFVQSESEIAPILRKAGERQNVLVVFTLSDPALRESTARMCELSNIPFVDLFGPMFDVMTVFFDRPPLGSSGAVRTRSGGGTPTTPHNEPWPRRRRQVLSDDYYRRIEAVEYTLQCDDGMNPALLSRADVILLGVSRTGKTPLSVVLAQTMGLKVANVPLVVDLAPPHQVLNAKTINPKRVFVLTLDPDDLMRIRRARMARELKNSSVQKSTYADRQYLLADLKHAREIALEYDFTEIDVTGRAVEETASLVRSLLNDRFGDQIGG